MEEWHQKLHNNTSPDDVVICQALIAYLENDLDISHYWSVLQVLDQPLLPCLLLWSKCGCMHSITIVFCAFLSVCCSCLLEACPTSGCHIVFCDCHANAECCQQLTRKVPVHPVCSLSAVAVYV